MEEVVRLVGDVLVAVHAARRDDAERGAVGEERAHLHGRGVRAEQERFVALQEVRVLHVARRVVVGEAEGREVVPVGLHLWAFGDGEAEVRERPQQVVERLREDVAAALRRGAARGQAEVGRIGAAGGRGGAVGGGEARFGGVAQGVQAGADAAALVGRQFGEALEEVGERAGLASEDAHAERLARRFIGGDIRRVDEGGKGVDVVEKGHGAVGRLV